MKSIFIGTPSSAGLVHSTYAVSLVSTSMFLSTKSIHVITHIECGGTLLVQSRNRIISDFLKSTASHLLFVDSDIGWLPEDLFRMLNRNQDFVAGVYPGRKGEGYVFRPKTEDNGSVKMEQGLIDAECVPAGFMLLSREAILKMINFHSDRMAVITKHDRTTEKISFLFNTEVIDGSFWGEDFVFCLLANKAGIDIKVDPHIVLDHAGCKGALVETFERREVTS
jgi:hypothetical protein